MKCFSPFMFNCSSSVSGDFNTESLAQSYLLAGEVGSQTPMVGPACRVPNLPLC